MRLEKTLDFATLPMRFIISLLQPENPRVSNSLLKLLQSYFCVPNVCQTKKRKIQSV